MYVQGVVPGPMQCEEKKNIDKNIDIELIDIFLQNVLG